MYKRGFSLIEFLTVIAIIGTLLTIVISVSYSTRVKARDTKRKQDLQLIKTTIITYKAERGVYPYNSIARCTSTVGGEGLNAGWSLLENNLRPYLYPLPTDPLGGRRQDGTCGQAGEAWLGTGPHAYTYAAPNVQIPNVTRYSVWAGLENGKDADANGTTGASEAYGGANNYKGKYKNLYYYTAIVTAASLGGPNDNAANIYGVGCFVKSITDPASPCYNN